jgi:hypothetical protein
MVFETGPLGQRESILRGQTATSARYSGLANQFQAQQRQAAARAADAARYQKQVPLYASPLSPSPVNLTSFNSKASFPDDPFLQWKKGMISPFSSEGINQASQNIFNYMDALKEKSSENVFGISTDAGKTGMNPDPYPTVLPSLSAEQLGALSERRRLADERLKRAETEAENRRGLLGTASDRARSEAERNSRRSVEDFMRTAAGRGVARSPLVAGRKLRREGEDLRLAYGEIDTRLSTDIMALQNLVARAAEERDSAIAGISQEQVNMQADLERLFPAAGMYR